jgi:hypothetical protein
MIGFLIHDERLFSPSSAVSACRALSTYSYQNTENMGTLRIHFFQNQSVNNYCLTDERYTICATGTLIFNDVHGDRALSNLRDALYSGKELVQLSEQFRGPYTLIQIDRVMGQVSVLNSREGLRGCFLTTRNDLRAYSTNLLLLAALTGAAPCAEGIRDFIHLGATMDDKTIFENVERLSAASLHVYRNERWTTSRLWRLQVSEPDRRITRQIATETLIKSILRNLEFTANFASGKVAADLTGGTDTRLVLFCLMKKRANAVTSTSGRDDFIDVRIARRIADNLGLEHYRYDPASVQMTDERIARAVELADGNQDVTRLAKHVPYYEEKARRFDFIAGGVGGALFTDHYWLFEFNRVGLRREPNWDRIARLSVVAHAVDDFFSGFNEPIVGRVTELLRRCSAAIKGTNNQKLDFMCFDLKFPAFFGSSFSLATQFMDVFHPLADADNVQYSINLPPEIRILNILQFDMIQKLQPELRWIQTDKGLPTVPPVGVNSWLRVLRGRRYIRTGFRKVRRALMGSSGLEGTNRATDIEQLRSLGYFDFLEHSSLAASAIISASKLAGFKDSPAKQPNQHYLIATLSVELFFRRAKELMDEAKRVRVQPSSIPT